HQDLGRGRREDPGRARLVALLFSLLRSGHGGPRRRSRLRRDQRWPRAEAQTHGDHRKMCGTCGCSDGPGRGLLRHSFPAAVMGRVELGMEEKMRLVRIERDILAANDQAAAGNRRQLRATGTLALNLMSSPGSGKTTILERTVRHLGGDRVKVIEG